MTSKERIELKESQVLYKKVGKRYVPVTDTSLMDGLRDGWYLVKCQPSSTSYYARVYPDKAELETAIKDAADVLVKLLGKAIEGRPQRELTAEQFEDWEKLNEKHPDMFKMIYYPSRQDIAEKFLKTIVNRDY